MALLPTGPQYGVKYTLTGPDGTTAVFNDSTDPNNVGTLTEITGFDSPDVRESAEDLVQMDGGLHGDFFYGRRPITMSGLIHEHSDSTDRNMKMTRLMQATNAMRGDAVLQWTPDGSVQQQFVTLRRQQPLRISGGWNKEFQVAMVAADPRIYSADLHSSGVTAAAPADIGVAFDVTFDADFGTTAPPTGQIIVVNQGNSKSYPVYYVFGGGVNPSILNFTNGSAISLLYTLSTSEVMVIDSLNRTVQLGTYTSPGGVPTVTPGSLTNKYSAVNFSNTLWDGLDPGANDVRLGFFTSSGSASLRVDWRDAWL